MLKRTQKVVTLHWKKTWTHGSTRSINILSSLSITVRSRCCGDPNAIGPIKDFESRYLLWLDGLCSIQYELKAQVSLLTAVILDCIFKVEFLLDCVNCPAGKNTVFSSVAIFSRKKFAKNVFVRVLLWNRTLYRSMHDYFTNFLKNQPICSECTLSLPPETGIRNDFTFMLYKVDPSDKSLLFVLPSIIKIKS